MALVKPNYTGLLVEESVFSSCNDLLFLSLPLFFPRGDNCFPRFLSVFSSQLGTPGRFLLLHRSAPLPIDAASTDGKVWLWSWP